MRKKIRFIIPGIITLILMLILFYIQGLYPFTNNSVVQVDADYQFIPVLYRIYDFLHGNGNIIYDDIGFGNNIYISMIIQGSLFSPLSLLLYFTSRDNIVNYYNIIVIVKMCLLSLTTYIYIDKSFKVKEYYKIVFSVLYAFSGWVLLDYFNIMWLDSVILFPLIIMYLNELLNKGKYLGYIITLSLSLMISYYISYFILLFIVFYSFLYIFIKLDKDKIKKRIFCLGKGAIISLMISSFSLLPALYQTFISSRFDSLYRREIIYNFMNKSLYLLFSAIFLVIFIMLLFRYKGNKKDKKNIYIYIMLFILFGIGLFVEPINLSIHMGSYWGFPYRYSFVTIFILMNGSLYYLSRYGINGFSKYLVLRIIIFILILGGLLYLNSIYYKGIVDSQVILDFDDEKIYMNILIIFLMLCLLIILSLSFKNKIIKYISFSIVCLVQIFVFSSWCIYYNDGYYLSKTSNLVNSNIEFDRDSLERYKMGYTDYSPDYGFIYDVNTLDNWLHILPDSEIDLYYRLGYKNSDTCLRSYGGTIFSDWLFNVGYLFDDKYYGDNELYTMISRYYKYYYYEYNYNNGFGLVYENNNSNIDYSNLYGFYLQNQMYRDLFNNDGDIIKIDEYSFDIIDNKIEFSYDIDEYGFLYMYTLDNIEIEAIKVDDSYINFKDNDYILDFGMYEDNVLIEIFFDDADKINFSMGFIKYNDIMELSSNVSNVTKLDNGYDIDVYNDMDNGYIFLPINNIDGLKAYVNDREVEIDSYMDNFVSIKLDDGNNEIRIRYEMPLFKLGIFISIVGIILLILFNRIPSNKIILDITYYVYIFICLFIYVYIYGYSMIKYFKL